MTKADLTEAIYERVGFSKKESAELIHMVFDTMKEVLINGENLKISGFGTFQVREKQPRVGRNPQTGESLVISGRRVVTFKPSQRLKETMNAE
mgnify:CR=1 FL=1